MRIITFDVKQQKIRNTNSTSGVYSGTNNYLKLVFNFNNDSWGDCVKAVVFGDKGLPILLKDDSCLVPDEAFDSCKLSFYIVGKRKDGYRIETQEFTIRVKE